MFKSSIFKYQCQAIQPLKRAIVYMKKKPDTEPVYDLQQVIMWSTVWDVKIVHLLVVHPG